MKRSFSIIVLIFIVGLAAVAGAQERPKYVDGEVIVKFKSHVTDTDSAVSIQKAGGISARSIGPAKRRAYRIKLPAGLSVERAIERFKADPNVEYVEPNYIYYLNTTPDDPNFTEQMGLNNTGQLVNGVTGIADADIDAPEAWAIRTDASSIIVAVIDSGVQWDHPDLSTNIYLNTVEAPGDVLDGIDNDGNGYIDDVFGWDFVIDDNNPYDDNGHGTHVAGIIGAVGNNGTGVSGVAWQVKLLPLKTADSAGSSAVSDIIDAINYAVLEGARVINLSLGNYTYAQLFHDAIEDAGASGVLVVAAAGNEVNNNDLTAYYPSSYELDNIISVAATNASDGLARFSNYGGNSVYIAAPGDNIYSTYYGTSYTYLPGTSMATPMVSGALALLEAENSGLSYKEIREILLLSVDPLSSLAGKAVTGGRLNVYRALTFDLSQSEPAPPSHFSATINSDNSLSLSWLDNSTIETAYTIETKDLKVYDTAPYAALATLNADSTSYTTAVYEGQPCFRVKASNSFGDSSYSSEGYVSPAPPFATSGLTATTLSTSAISLSWVDNSSIEDSFIVEYSIDGINFVEVLTVSANVNTAEISGLNSGTTYTFRVATDSVDYGSSDYSNTATATTTSTDDNTGVGTGGSTDGSSDSGGSGEGGDGTGGGNRSGCFIATAAHGDAHAPDVETLRSFRDVVLLTNPAGREFVRLYYIYSPSIAAQIEGRPALMFAVRTALQPLVLSVRYPVPALAVVLCGPVGYALFRRRRK